MCWLYPLPSLISSSFCYGLCNIIFQCLSKQISLMPALKLQTTKTILLVLTKPNCPIPIIAENGSLAKTKCIHHLLFKSALLGPTMLMQSFVIATSTAFSLTSRSSTKSCNIDMNGHLCISVLFLPARKTHTYIYSKTFYFYLVLNVC